jgi:predicted transcriptional regulator
MSIPIKVVVGGGAEDDAAAFERAWTRAEHGEQVQERVLAFETWEALSSMMTGERYRLLRHLHAHPEPSVSALARALGRQYRRVHDDVSALEDFGLVERADGQVRTTTDAIQAEIRL